MAVDFAHRRLVDVDGRVVLVYRAVSRTIPPPQAAMEAALFTGTRLVGEYLCQVLTLTDSGSFVWANWSAFWFQPESPS